MLVTRTNTTVKLLTPAGGHLNASYGKGQTLADIICNLIKHTGLKRDAEAVKQIQAELEKL